MMILDSDLFMGPPCIIRRIICMLWLSSCRAT